QLHFMRAIIEGINYALWQVAESVQETIGAMQHIFASGGFINSPLWLQWLTDLFGKEIWVINKEDASSIGAAILGLQALGILKQDEPLTFFHVQQHFHPAEPLHQQYRKYYTVYASLYNKLKDAFMALSDINENVK